MRNTSAVRGYRFSRRAVREYTRWGDTQLKIHLARLTELEYLLVHRGGRGQSFEYELLFDGETNTDTPHASGLIDIDDAHTRLRCRAVGVRRTAVGIRSGLGRYVVGGRISRRHRSRAPIKPAPTTNPLPPSRKRSVPAAPRKTASYPSLAAVEVANA